MGRSYLVIAFLLSLSCVFSVVAGNSTTPVDGGSISSSAFTTPSTVTGINLNTVNSTTPVGSTASLSKFIGMTTAFYTTTGSDSQLTSAYIQNTQSVSYTQRPTFHTMSYPMNTSIPSDKNPISNTSFVALIIAGIATVLLAIVVATFVVVIIKVRSKHTVHLHTADHTQPGTSEVTSGDVITECDANPSPGTEQSNEVVAAPSVILTSSHTVQRPSDYIYSVSAASRNAREGSDYALPNEIRRTMDAELVESNGYVSSHTLRLNHQQSTAKQVEEYIYATSTQIGSLPTINVNDTFSSNSHENAFAQSEGLVISQELSSKSVCYINHTKQSATEAEPFSKHQEEMDIVAERASKPLDNDEAFVQPANDEWALYAQFKKIKVKLLDPSIIKMSSILGSGQFGTVNQGVWETANGAVPVAIKVLNPEKAGVDKNKIKFLREVAIMGQFCHPNVVTLHGIVTEGGTMMMVLELLEKGDLKRCLISRIPDPKSPSSYDGLSQNLLKYCHQIASGMEYLTEKAFIHRDLAARNILVSYHDICKIADFGMSRDLEDDTYYISRGGKIPLRWTAPEALQYKKYSSASDVWSYGCVMYEIWSMGEKLYTNHSNYNILNIIESGYRIPPPPGCPRSIYKIMIECWHPVETNRPSFACIKQSLLKPEETLLKWTDDDQQVHPQASIIKAPLEAASGLYEDLQKTYLL